jgi:hypothetical protein
MDGYERAHADAMERELGKKEPRPLRSNLTPQEQFRLEEYGSIHFESAGAKKR